MQAAFLDESVIEQMVLQFRESEYHLEGFDTVSVDRKAQSLVFKFRREAPEDEVFTVAYGMFDGHRTNQITGHLEMRKGDVFIITYTLAWSKFNGDDIADSPSPPGAGRTLKLTHSFSTAV